MQHDLSISNADGETVRLDIIDALQALATCQAGPTAPDPTFPNQNWLDTSATPHVLKKRTNANNNWFTLATIDGTTFIPYRDGKAVDVIATAMSNLAATADPTVNNDGTQGYSAGSRMLNTLTGELFECVSAATGAAVWKSLTRLVGVKFSSSPSDASGTGTDSIAIGSAAATSTADKAIAVGKSASASANNAVAIGQSVANDETDTVRVGTSAITYLKLNANGALSLAGTKPAFVIPAYATTNRPTSPTTGMTVYDTDLGELITYGGAAWVPVAKAYDVGTFIDGKPATSEVVLRHVAARAFAFPASLTGSVLKAGTAATAQTVFSCKKNGAEFGTITVAASGTTATFAAASSTSFAAADVLAIVAPATADGTLADIAITLKGTRT